MKEPEMFRQIAVRHIRKESFFMYENVAQLKLSEDGADLMGEVDWICWAVEHQEESETIIKEICEGLFPGDEITVMFASMMGGTRDYIWMVATTITLQEVLDLPGRLSKLDEFKSESELFIRIAADRIVLRRLINAESELVFSSDGSMATEDQVAGMHWVDWWLLRRLDYDKWRFSMPAVETKLFQELLKRWGSGDRFEVEISIDKRSVTIKFD
ncbi:MAG: hypothetical protein JWM20_621 [Patescibacteria group bacterium]|nr:hypothetical protein [Patescibacteria group bacterium]